MPSAPASSHSDAAHTGIRIADPRARRSNVIDVDVKSSSRIRWLRMSWRPYRASRKSRCQLGTAVGCQDDLASVPAHAAVHLVVERVDANCHRSKVSSLVQPNTPPSHQTVFTRALPGLQVPCRMHGSLRRSVGPNAPSRSRFDRSCRQYPMGRTCTDHCRRPRLLCTKRRSHHSLVCRSGCRQCRQHASVTLRLDVRPPASRRSYCCKLRHRSAGLARSRHSAGCC